MGWGGRAHAWRVFLFSQGMMNINVPEHTQSRHNPYDDPPEMTERDAGAPVGQIVEMDSDLLACKVYPGVSRSWWVYVPAQYSEDTPANLLLCFDGGGAIADGVLMDNLIR